MKTIKFISVFLLFVIISTGISAQTGSSIKTEGIKVSGNCGMCKARIEKAAMVDGVSKAGWNEKSKILTLVYDTTKVSSLIVQTKIAAVGHDTEKVTADKTAYDQLPACCKYR